MLDKEKYKIRYKNNLEKFNMQITEIEKTTKKYRYIEKLKNKMEEGLEIIGVENASTESLDRYIELSDLEKDLKSVYDKQKEAIYTFMIVYVFSCYFSEFYYMFNYRVLPVWVEFIALDYIRYFSFYTIIWYS